MTEQTTQVQGFWDSLWFAVNEMIVGEVDGHLFALSLALNVALLAPYVWMGIRASWRHATDRN